MTSVGYLDCLSYIKNNLPFLLRHICCPYFAQTHCPARMYLHKYLSFSSMPDNLKQGCLLLLFCWSPWFRLQYSKVLGILSAGESFHLHKLLKTLMGSFESLRTRTKSYMKMKSFRIPFRTWKAGLWLSKRKTSCKYKLTPSLTLLNSIGSSIDELVRMSREKRIHYENLSEGQAPKVVKRAWFFSHFLVLFSSIYVFPFLVVSRKEISSTLLSLNWQMTSINLQF